MNIRYNNIISYHNVHYIIDTVHHTISFDSDKLGKTHIDQIKWNDKRKILQNICRMKTNQGGKATISLICSNVTIFILCKYRKSLGWRGMLPLTISHSRSPETSIL